MNWNELEPKVNRLQDSLLMTMEKIKSLSKEEPQLPQPEGKFEVAKEILENREYDVVVCGEVKKGKSSFINAIVGQGVLPVNSDIATSQVFRLSNSTDGQEHFSLCFTDGTERTIQRNELAKYGSQVEANENGTPEFDGKTLAYIKVEVSATFLPQGVSLVDTPGLGALYKSHEYITQTYINKAAAVVFVLDYERPIAEQEMKFINKVLDVTPYVLFVITKSDLYAEKESKAIISRDEGILAGIYDERNLKAPRIYPVSSSALMRASQNRIEKMRKASFSASGFSEIESQLMRLIYRAVGLLRTDNAISASVNYVNRVNQIIGDILQTCKADSDAIMRQVEQDKGRVQAEFQKKWNDQGEQRKEIMKKISQICDRFELKAKSLVSSNGELYQGYLKRIDSINSLSTAKTIGINVPKEFAEELPQRWKSLAENAISEVSMVIYQAQAQMDKSSYQNVDGLNASDALDLSGSDLRNIVKCSLGPGMLIIAVVNVIFNPAAWVAIILGILASLVFGIDAAISSVKNKTKQEINKLMSQVSQKIQLQSHELANNLRFESNKALQDGFQIRKDEIQAELEDLQRRGQMQLEEKKQESQKWTQIKSHWDEITSKLRTIIQDRTEILQTLNS